MRLSQGLAITALAGLVFTLVLAIRSLNIRPQWHRWVGTLAVLAVILHAGAEVFDLGFASALEVELWPAWLAILILIIVVVAALAPIPKHRLWRRFHLLSAPALALVGWHALEWMGESNSEKVWVLGLLIVLGLAWVRAEVLPRLKSFGRRGRVTQVRRLSPKSNELTISVETGPPFVFEPGQFWYVKFLDPNFTSDWHPFSPVSITNAGDLIFAVKNLGLDTSQVTEHSTGMNVALDGPYGHLIEPTAATELWIVGGMGVTPALSWFQDARVQSRKVRMIYCVEQKGDILYPEMWDAIQKRSRDANSNLEVQIWDRQTRGNFSKMQLQEALQGFGDGEIYISGPKPFVRMIRSWLKQEGVTAQHLHSEDLLR